MYFYRQLLYISEEVADPHTAEAKNSIFFYITWNCYILRNIIFIISMMCWHTLYNNLISCSIQNVFKKYPVKMISLKSDVTTY